MNEGENTLRNCFAEVMLEVGTNDSRLVVLVGDISHFVLQPFANACRGRYFNIGICEQTMIGVAAGMSLAGLIPVVHTISPFIVERSFEQLKMDFCYQKLGGNIITVGSAFDYTALGCSHYCYGDFALIKSLPGSEIVYPAMPNEFVKLFKETYDNNRLTYFRLSGSRHEVEIKEQDIVFGKAVVVRPGDTLTIIATGPHLGTVVDALPELYENGISPEVIYVHTVKPFDYNLIADSIGRTGKYIVVEEHSKFGGVADEVARACADLDQVRCKLISIPDTFLHSYGSYHEHCEFLGFTEENIVSLAKDLVGIRGR